MMTYRYSAADAEVGDGLRFTVFKMVVAWVSVGTVHRLDSEVGSLRWWTDDQLGGWIQLDEEDRTR